MNILQKLGQKAEKSNSFAAITKSANLEVPKMKLSSIGHKNFMTTVGFAYLQFQIAINWVDLPQIKKFIDSTPREHSCSKNTTLRWSNEKLLKFTVRTCAA